MSNDPGIDEIVHKIKRRLAQVNELMDSLIVTASVQEYAEKQFGTFDEFLCAACRPPATG